MMSLVNLVRCLNFLRIEYINFSAICFLLGFFSTHADLKGTLWITVLISIFAFHFFTSWQNDFADFEIDRTHPLRKVGVFIEGIWPKNLLIQLALIQIPILFAIALLSHSKIDAYLYMASALGFMSIYNFFGKKCKYPLITDIAQGIAWGSFSLFGASLFGNPINLISIFVALYFLLLMLIINGIHGGLKDLKNDQSHGAITACIFLGARVENGEVIIPKAVYVYSILTHLAISALSLLVGCQIPTTYPVLFFLALLLLNFISLTYLVRVLRNHGSIFDGVCNSGEFLLLILCVSFAPHLNILPNVVLFSFLAVFPALCCLRYPLLLRILKENPAFQVL